WRRPAHPRPQSMRGGRAFDATRPGKQAWRHGRHARMAGAASPDRADRPELRGLKTRMREAEMADYQRIAVKPLAGALGAEIGEVDLSQPLDPETVAEIKRAFSEYLV